ncbi:pyridoxamine 5'-phosphate oxidase [Hyphomicrobium sp.]|uniref:pyridoxamine 5'-phosphate oxidase n=1 Tax=Hyphomicrobium sp. TaxID=82 RepID=UPI0025C1E1AB|nr:pyridoxamine 5'-phosphate oxidase [Hyphomicrobium sp.]MCC7250255.1 pyridoxamine 5'-phosphate oxidase [Hyphomicrobium sp.]
MSDDLQRRAETEPDHFTAGDDPFALFEAWLAEAASSEPNDPNGMALATVDGDGLPNVRMVLLKGVDGAEHPARGFVFFTNLESAKGRELAASHKAALLFHWKSLRRQVRARGLVTPVSAEEADLYFATRPRLSRIGAWASDQSRPLESRFALEKKVAEYTAKFGIGDIPRPPHWSGFRLTPVEIELWRDRPFRLHDRVVFRRADVSESWTKARLYP